MPDPIQVEVKQNVSEKLQKLSQNTTILWGVAFIGVCVLVGMGKLKPETIEYLLFAMLGHASHKKTEGDKDESN